MSTGRPAVEIVAASAGSGKTHHLATTLQQEVAAGRVRPEAVVAVTFTIKAAAELEERVRSHLIGEGRPADAQRLGAARIGTVHGVCARILSEFAFELGLPPEQHVLDARLAGLALQEALETVLTPERTRQAAELGLRLHDFRVGVLAREIIDRARVNAITSETLRDCARRSWAGLRDVLPEPLPDGSALESALRAALEAFERDSPAADATKATAEARRRVGAALNRMRGDRALRWDAWARFDRLGAGARSRAVAEGVRAAAHDFQRHPQLSRDLERATELVFQVAADALDEYQHYKRRRGLVDFTDQLALALEALRKPAVRRELEDQIDLVLVDEFQDTSPIQLAIFVELARLAERSIWVGDQKQAIFGFLQADPALMDSAIEALLDKEPKTLKVSYRSRPELVHLTSAVFAPAFERVGIPAGRTELAPEKEEEPEGLGPVVERWHLAGRRKAERAAAIAAGVRTLLEDAAVAVRDEGNGTRRPGPGDIAVLCRTNDECLEVAEALDAIGISSVVERKGLLATPEAELVLAGLRLWVDGRDALARATLARLAASSGDADAWLEVALREPWARGFAATDLPEAMDLRRKAAPTAGLVQALDDVIEAVNARDLAIAWGGREQRLANLDALRALAVSYLGESASRDAVGTIGGFLAWLETVEAAGQDARAEAGGSDAVFVGTFHGAKGLEWPITVLRDHEWEAPASALGIHVAEEAEDFDFDDPLAGRWIRFWPNPFYPSRKTFLQEGLADHPLTETLERRERREALRLLYVGWTRARDRLVIASRSSRRLEKIFARVASDEGPLVLEPEGDVAVWAGRKVILERRELTAAAPEKVEATGGEAYEAPGPTEHPPALLSPSSLVATGTGGEPERIGERLGLTGSPDMNIVGEVFHRFFAADRPDLPDDERRSLAAGLLERWGLGENLEAGLLLEAGDALGAWVEKRWPGATWRREWPLARRLDNGTTLRGFADLVLELEDGFALVDHKTFPGGHAQAQERAAEYAGQLGAYVDAISAATGKDPVGSFIHLPVSGVVVEVKGRLDRPADPTQLSLFSDSARS